MDLKRLRRLNKISDIDMPHLVDKANCYKNVTGIPGRVLISSAYPNQSPRLKYKIDNTEITVSIEDNPETLAPKSLKGTFPFKFKGIIEWIRLNKDVLLEYWDDSTMSFSKLARSLKPVKTKVLKKGQ